MYDPLLIATVAEPLSAGLIMMSWRVLSFAKCLPLFLVEIVSSGVAVLCYLPDAFLHCSDICFKRGLLVSMGCPGALFLEPPSL